jgi:hypothetical protein
MLHRAAWLKVEDDGPLHCVIPKRYAGLGYLLGRRWAAAARYVILSFFF